MSSTCDSKHTHLYPVLTNLDLPLINSFKERHLDQVTITLTSLSLLLYPTPITTQQRNPGICSLYNQLQPRFHTYL